MADYKTGHRRRLFNKLSKYDVGSELMYSYELIEILLFFVNRRRDTREISKELLDKFKTVGRLISASREELLSHYGVGEQTALLFRIVHELLIRINFEKMLPLKKVSSLPEAVDYCKSCMASLSHEQVRMLCLNKRNRITSDVILANGSLDYVCIDIRTVISKALLSGAHAVILTHNHPSGSVYPSDADLKFTSELKEIAGKLKIKLYDHIIISENEHFSMKQMRII